MARATFTGNHLLDSEPGDPWDDSELRGNRSGCTRDSERWLDQDEHNSHRLESSFRATECPRPPSPPICTSCDTSYRHADTLPPPPEVSIKFTRFKKPAWEDKDRKMDDLMERMHGLLVREKSYAVLYM